MITQRSTYYPVLFGLLAAGLVISCNGDRGPVNEIELARVGSEVLTLQNAVNSVPPFMLREDSVGSLKNHTRDWVQRQVFLQEAQRLQLAQRPEINRRMKRLQEEVLVEALQDIVISRYEEDLEVTDEEAQNYYQAHKDRFILNERFIRFRHISTPDIESARAAKQDLMRGIEWPEVARRYSVNPEMHIRLSQQFWPISMALKDLEIMNDLLQRIGITEISPIRRIDGNYHFVQLIEARSSGDHPDLDWLIDQIKEWLTMEKKRRHFNSFAKNLYLKAESNNEIEIHNVLTPESTHSNEPIDTLVTQQPDE